MVHLTSNENLTPNKTGILFQTHAKLLLNSSLESILLVQHTEISKQVMQRTNNSQMEVQWPYMLHIMFITEVKF